jgi:hypothetical protein
MGTFSTQTHNTNKATENHQHESCMQVAIERKKKPQSKKVTYSDDDDSFLIRFFSRGMLIVMFHTYFVKFALFCAAKLILKITGLKSNPTKYLQYKIPLKACDHKYQAHYSIPVKY